MTRAGPTYGNSCAISVSIRPQALPSQRCATLSPSQLPWMDADEVEIYIEHVNRLPIYERTPTARKLGENMLLSNADRERLKLWPIKPYDMTDAELEAQRKTKINERRRASGRPARTIKPLA